MWSVLFDCSHKLSKKSPIKQALEGKFSYFKTKKA